MTEAIHYLITRGHAFDDLWRRYTIDQVETFYNLAVKQQKRETIELITGIRIAFGANEQQWQKYIKAMLEIPHEHNRMTKEQYAELRRLLNGK